MTEASPIFLSEGGLLAGQYMLGAFSWPDGRVLQSALLVVRPSPDSEISVGLEVGGTLTGHTIVVPPSTATELRISIALNHAVAADAVVRWKFLQPTDAAGGEASLTLSSAPPGREPDPLLRVEWVSGDERLEVLTYNHATGAWAVTAAAAGRITLVEAPTWRLSVAGVPAFEVTASEVRCPEFRENPSLGSPRLEFKKNHAVLMSVLTTGMETVLREVSPTAVGAAGFEFEVAGVLRATLSGDGLRASSFVETAL